MKKFLSILLIFVSMSLCSTVFSETPIEQLDVQSFLDLLKTNPSIQVIDVRPPEKRAAAYLTISKNITVNTLEARLNEIDTGKPVVVCCQSGRTSTAAAQILAGHNVARVLNITKGLMGFFEYLSKEPETVAANPARKADFDKIREIIKTARPFVGLNMPAVSLESNWSKRASLSEYAGKPVILSFFKSDDKNQIDLVEKVLKSYQLSFPGIAVVPIATVSSDSEKASFEQTIAGRNWSGPVYFDINNSLAYRLGLSALPNFCIIDSDGIIRATDITDPVNSLDAFGGKTLDQLAAIVASGKIPPFPLSNYELAELRQNRLIGKTAPDFDFKDLNGKSFKLSELKNKKNALIIFGSLGCPYTRKEMEIASSCYENLDKKNNEVIAVLPGNNFQVAEQATQFAQQSRIGYRILMDSKQSSFKDYFIESVPVWWIVDKKGNIRYHQVGMDQNTCTRFKSEVM
ncbi:MAG TPA: redoxin domain-containing protein [bacterium]|nr:redoxin domain-containing protein [bacterium]